MEKSEFFKQIIRQGRWPFDIPFGYTTGISEIKIVKQTARRRAVEIRTIEVDSHNATIIRAVFDLYLNKKLSVRRIQEEILTTYSHQLTLSYIPLILRNKFYAGSMVYLDLEVFHNYGTIIDATTFINTQKMLEERSKPQNKSSKGGFKFALKSLIKCSICNKLLSGDIKKGVKYYACSLSLFRHSRKYVTQKALEGHILDKLKSIHINSDFLSSLNEYVSRNLQLIKDSVCDWFSKGDVPARRIIIEFIFKELSWDISLQAELRSPFNGNNELDFTVRDIMGFIGEITGYIQEEKPHYQSAKDEVSIKYSEDTTIQEKIIRTCIKSTSLDTLVDISRLDIPELQSYLFDLVLHGHIQEDQFGNYVTIKK